MSKEKLIFNQNVLLAFTGTVQSAETTINVPFRVKRITFYPPRCSVNAAAPGTDQYLLRSSLNNGNGVVGFVDALLTGQQTTPIVVTYEQPRDFNGLHKFQIQSFEELAGNGVNALVTKVWLTVSFEEA